MRLKLEIMNTRGIISLAASALIIAAASARADSIVWTNTAGGNWSDTNSWSPNQIPGDSDVAVITNDGTYSVTLDVNPNIGGLVLGTAGGTNIQSLSVSNNQTFTLNGTAQVSTNGQFNLNGGVLGGNIALCGALNCLGGTLSGGLTVNSNSVVTVSAPGLALNGFTSGGSALTNYGTVNWTGGDISCDYSPQIYNFGLWNAQTDNSIFGQQTSGNTTFNNFGIFRKSGTGGTSTLDFNTIFTSSGTIDVESGTVSVTRGQAGGAVNIASGATLSPGNNLVFAGGTVFSGTGNVIGLLSGSNAVFSGVLNYSGTTLSGTMTVASNSVLNLGTASVNLVGVGLTNYGTVNWTGGDLDCNNSPQIYNYGLWNAETDNTFVGQINGGAGNGVFNNYGTFRKSGGTNMTAINADAVLNSSGIVDVESGTISIYKGQVNGGVNAAGGAVLSLGHIVVFGGGTLFSGAGNVAGYVNGSNAVFSGTMTCSGVTISGAITVATNAVVNLGTLGISFNNGYNNTALLTNYGTINWSSDLTCDGGPRIFNFGLWNAQTDNSIFGQQTSGNTTFNNFGTFRKSGGTNTSMVDFNTIFTSSGTMDVESGTVSVTRGQAGGAVNIVSGATLLPGNNLIFAGGTIFSGTGTVAGLLNGNNAQFSGGLNYSGTTLSGTMTIASNSVLNLGTVNVNLVGMALTNYGTVNWTGGDLECNNSPHVYNYGLWNAETDNTFVGQFNGGAGNGVFNNYGIFRKAAGTNTTKMDADSIFNSSGTVDVESGTISIYKGQVNGGVNAAGGAVLSLGHLVVFGGGTLFSGAGNVAGFMNGSNAVFSGTMTCSGVTISGAITVATNAVVNLGTLGISVNNGYNNTALLTNYGTINWSSDLTCDGGPQIFNFGLWNAQSDNSIFGQQTSGTTTFNNYGIFRKSGGTNTSTVDFNTIFTSSGTIDVESGTVSLSKGSISGTVTAAGSTVLSLGHLVVFGGNTLFSGAGNVAGYVNGSNAVFSGTMTCSGVTISGAITVVTNAVVNLGTLGVSFNNGYNNTALLTNYGTVNWSTGNFAGDNNPKIYNYGLWNDQADNTLFGQQTSGNTTFNNFGTFRKSGTSGITTLDNSTVFNNTGTLDVQTGTVSILGARTLTGGTLNFAINSPNIFGHITLAGAVTLTGTVSVNLNSLYTPTNGTSFALLTYGSESGTFTSFNLPVFFGWTNNYGPASFSLIIVSAPMRVLNVTNFGAVGDAVQFFVNTTSNSVVVTTTNQIPNSAIGEAIEVFGAGVPTSSSNNQDLVTTIANVMNGTNIYVSQVCQQTLTNTFATYGQDNTTNFQNAITATGSDTNDIIYIPAGTYFFICPYVASAFGNAGIILTRGGIHFVGAGANSTTLLSRGAWNLIGGAVYRSFLIDIQPHIANDFPVSFENLTLDGGVQQGNTGNHNFPASPITGMGWDIDHDAIVVRGGATGNVFTHQTWTNVVFQHWRGEMVKSNDASTNGNLSIFNCAFNDGNATAINYYASLNVSNCVFNNLFQVAEYYQAYSTNTSYFQNNFITNITGNGFALNGGKGNNPPFILQNNAFYLPGLGGNGILTTPGDNVFIVSNQFIFLQNGGNAIVLGSAGYQGTFDNSNIVIAGNSFVKPSTIVEISGETNGTGPNRVEAVQVYGNSLTQLGNSTMAVQTFGWSTNVHLSNNDFSKVTNSVIHFSSGIFGAQYALVDTNNLYYTPISDPTGITNSISYANGSRFQVVNPFHSGTVYALVDTHASQMPVGAKIQLYNNNSSSATVPVYLSSSLQGSPVTVASGQTVTFFWQDWNGTWSTNNKPPPPTGVRLNF
jgi:hypothetical protein